MNKGIVVQVSGPVIDVEFAEGHLPSACPGHSGGVTVCNETNLIATPYCPATHPVYTAVSPEEKEGQWVTSGYSNGNIPTATCNKHTAPPAPAAPATPAKPAANNTTKPTNTTPPANTTKPTNTTGGTNTTKPTTPPATNTTPQNKTQ